MSAFTLHSMILLSINTETKGGIDLKRKDYFSPEFDIVLLKLDSIMDQMDPSQPGDHGVDGDDDLE